MITMSNFGLNGRLGNQFFQYASMLGLSYKHGVALKLPEWEYAKYFETPPQIGNCRGAKTIIEPCFHYEPRFYEDLDWSENMDFSGYFQSEKYWEQWKDRIREAFKFKKFIKDSLNFKYDNVFSDKTIGIHIRRGDYINNPNYANLKITYYIQALISIKDWRDHNILIFSDDMGYARLHFACLNNVTFVQNDNDIEDVIMMSMCTNMIISNSSFSWWGAYLGENEDGVIIRPLKHFEGKLKEETKIKDFYPTRWKYPNLFGCIGIGRINLEDVTFTIPVSFDHKDRIENLELCIKTLRKYFTAKIMVVEQGKEKKFNHIIPYVDKYMFIKEEDFHRTKYLNLMALQCNTQIVANWDCDVFIAPMQILEAVEAIRDSVAVAYPYDGRFARVPRTYLEKLQESQDIGILGDTQFPGMEHNASRSFGGAVLFATNAFLEGGMENENFISFGPEDEERFERFNKLGYNIIRVHGPLYHLNHYVGVNSCNQNPHFENNNKEYEKVKQMNNKELSDYIETWSWNKTETNQTKQI